MSLTLPLTPGHIRRWALLAALSALAIATWPASSFHAQGGDPCAPPTGNPIACENAQPGNPKTEWDIIGAGDESIQGFATDISVNRGQTVQFKVDTEATAYRLDIYRLGYYGGMGARKVATVNPSLPLPQVQPPCANDFETGLVDCGIWGVSASWAVPGTAVSGVYVAKAVRTDAGPAGRASHIVFIVRQDNSTSDIHFQADDTTWQAYNNYGGNSLYVGSPAGRAYKVSYNRPFNTRAEQSGLGWSNWVFWGMYPMIRYLEANGFDVTYSSGVDTDRYGSQLLGHKVFLSAGHDEYWSAAQRANVEAARGAGVHLALFSGNLHYWKTRYEPSIDGSNTPYRTLVCYKETLDGMKIDPSAQWTGTWRDPRFSPPADGGRPENALVGTFFTVNRGQDNMNGTSIEVPEAEGKTRLWRNTSVATLNPGEVAVLSDNVLGYEWDEELDNGFRPGGLIRLSSTTEDVPERMVPGGYGAYEDFAPGTATHTLTLYKHTSGALVFSAGTIQWSWGLDAVHDGQASVPDVRMRQATLNMLADMGLQPKTREADLAAATPSTDTTLPASTITYPTSGLVVTPGTPVTVTGTASDSGGGIVAGVEISVDNGATWHPTVGKDAWTYEWMPTTTGNTTIRVRAVDDSANIQAPGATVAVSVVADTQAPQITARTPAPAATGVSTGAPVTATFNEAMNASSITTATFELRTPSNQVVPASVSYNSSTRTAVLQPTGLLAFNTAYTARVRGGATGVKDFSGNALAADATWSFTTWASPPCPCSLWNPATTTPSVADAADPNAYELGVKFRADYDGFITALRFYKSPLNTGTHTGKLWRSDGTLLGTLTFTNETTSGWQEAFFASPIAVTAGTGYVASYYAPNGHYSLDSSYFFAQGVNSSPLRSPGSLEEANGVYKPGASAFPDQSHNSSNYWVDVVYVSTTGDTTAPTISQRTPAPGATGVQAGTGVTATFNEAMSPATLTSTTFELRNPASQVVPATVTYTAASRTATLRSTASLAFGTTYTARVRGGATGVKDLAGNALAADSTWTFTTGAAPVCPCSLWDPATTTPAIPDSGDTGAYELGVRVKPDLDGYITGVRFYKSAGNVGTHVANLWSSTGGAPLASATFVGETGSGWQEVSFASPVPVTAQTSYVASYHAPSGHYAFTADYFATAGVSRWPLSSPVAAEGGNGLYKPGASGFPNQTHAAANYWVDVVYMSVGGDTTAPAVTTTAPAAGAASVGAAANVSATFNEAMSAASITTATFELRNATSQLVPAAVSYNPATRTALLDPTSPLAFGAAYTARVLNGAAGVKDLFGNALAAAVTWSFTVGAAPACPCSFWTTATVPGTVDSGDGLAYELGLKFRPEVDGLVTGVRFYKSAANTGTHVGSLWSGAGAILASATFTSETASGWQEVAFSSPVSVAAGTVYVVSYWAPAGHYAIDTNYFAAGPVTTGPLQALGNGESPNGVYRAGSSGFPTSSYAAANYWVDPLFVASGADTTAPTITARTPAPGATGVPVASVIEVTFSESMTPSSFTATTFVLSDASSQAVAAALGYNAAARKATLTPGTTLAFGATYTVTVKGAAGGVRDAAGNVLAADATWSFTTAAGASCPCSIWDPATATPAVIDSADSYAYELGVKFKTLANGSITGLRFYKSAANTGAHVAHLWTSTGTLLATASFTTETASGWQEVTFSTPVTVTAETTYVASYWAPAGRYSYNGAFFTAGDVGAGPVKAIGASSPNGVYRAGSSGFPTESWNGNNYWVDVVFTPVGS